MIKGIDVNQRIPFSSVNDTDEVKTVFIFQPMTAEALLNYVGGDQGGTLALSGDKLFDFLAMSIVEIQGYDQMRGTIKETLKTLPILVITELVTESGKINKITGTDQKN